MWIDWNYYIANYRQGMKPVIPETEFKFWEKQARQQINRKNIELETIPENLKDCTCEVAEYLYESEKANSDTLKSFSNDGYSESYADRSVSSSKMAADIRAIISNWLSNTELHNDFIFTGV